MMGRMGGQRTDWRLLFEGRPLGQQSRPVNASLPPVLSLNVAVCAVIGLLYR